ncbi:NUDIX hydrolase [Flavobacterium psychrotolerans]|uniref:Coenzyme A pyrophosphatase n=1 Tax=Flavobacterium psychrotolerans TaxID=2169410 RepID=A0A2U1JKA9_9FLAO|nr:CoA pyrophosphatase [Flavobacterium psychrotolerans]PWA05323.1 coenzyme A pyrophosphatase [Flavobacterium psychrotolerans]
MDFQDFLNCIPKIVTEPLLADLAHQIMEPPERKALMNNFDVVSENPRKAAVMMLFYPKNIKTHLVLIVRNSYPGVHSSQIAFPGGKVELEDLSIEHAALRETEEEIGVSVNKINVIKAFTQVYIPPSNFMVFPFLGYSTEELIFNPDPTEVSGIIELSIVDFLDENAIVNKTMSTSYAKDIQVPAFKIQEHYVWGATAMILSELKETLKKIL